MLSKDGEERFQFDKRAAKDIEKRAGCNSFAVAAAFSSRYAGHYLQQP